MSDCIFCKIAAKDIPSEIIYEDSEHMSFLDINPTTRGMTVVVTKKHFNGDFYSNDSKILCGAVAAAKETADLLKKKLGCERVLTSIEGLEIDHLHIKLYPYFTGKTVSETFSGTNNKAPSKEDLKNLANLIKS